jgi:hypothetical protein
MWQHIDIGSLASAFIGGALGAAGVCLYMIRSELATFRTTLEQSFMPREATEIKFAEIERRVTLLEHD